MGGKIDSSVNRGGAPYTYRISGENYHCIGSLLPEDGQKPRFSQIYIYDPENEISNRIGIFRQGDAESQSNSDLDKQIVQELQTMLDLHNSLVQSYRKARDSFSQNPESDLKLKLIGRRQQDGRTYNLPTASEVAALIVGNIGDYTDNRDIVVQTKSGRLKRVSELHPSYLPLQYPLLFPYADDGYRVDIPHACEPSENPSVHKMCTMREFFAYRIQDRLNVFSLILNSRRLLQQFLVDVYTMIESQRLHFIRNKQTNLRSETYENLRALQTQGNTQVSNVGQRVILPSSFTGGARYMMQNYLDAMAICKFYGYPDYFITITCNPKWPEVERYLKDSSLNAEDRPDIICRLFKMKLDSIIKDLKDKKILGKVNAVVYTVEFQKRGLPHAHICLFMDSAHKLHTVDQTNNFISAEIPDKNEDPELFYLVREFMMHGPCGAYNMSCPCMVDSKCSKNYPKKFQKQTSIDQDGFPLYRRRDNGVFVEKSGVQLDNRSVVPYNKVLLKRYQAHINVEWCNQTGSIRYLFKYINKGPDRVTVSVVDSDNTEENQQASDEIKKFFDCRYLSACEASWRIFAYDVHYRYPAVIRLTFHLPNQQHIIYGEDDDIDTVLGQETVSSSMFSAWFQCNIDNKEARLLTYVELPSQFVWIAKYRKWQFRKRGNSIGRIHNVSPSLGEAYFLRILLNKVKGPKSFEDILTVNGRICSTFREACYRLGLLDDDSEYIEAIHEASHAGSGNYLRNLFATMLLSNSLSRPEFVWQKTWQYLSEDILYRQRKRSHDKELSLTEEQIQNLALLDIENFLLRNSSSLRNFSTMPFPDDDSIESSTNRLISEELSYDKNDLIREFDNMFPLLTEEQQIVYTKIVSSVEEKKGAVYFLYGYGGTGKTFLWKTLSASLRSKGQIVLNVASSGIASLLLTGGRTAHSRFSIPINLNEDSICYVKPGCDLAILLKKADLIIWDEAPMMHKHAIEALDKTLKDICSDGSRNVSSLLFGGKVVVFGGDFRQILPVIQHGSRHDIVNASLSSSYIWDACEVLKLTKNMRLSTGIGSSSFDETKRFADWLLDIGEGNIGVSNGDHDLIDIPADLLINQSLDPVSDLINFVYPSVLQHTKDPKYFQERAILAPKNEVVEEINHRLLSLFPGDAMEYLSSDSVCQSDFLDDNFDESLYSGDVLNAIKVSGMPNHKLVLKVGVPVMLLRNIDQKNGLCNGTRLQVIKLGNRVIEAEIISGSNVGYRTFLPRISLTPSDKKIPFKLKRRQFPLSVCFAMTINKSQGQSLSKVGLYLKQPVFTHGQLYVALSRVTSRDGLKILALDTDGKASNKTSNVVYKEILQCL